MRKTYLLAFGILGLFVLGVARAGDVTPEKVNGLAEKYFGSWKPGSYAADIPAEPPQKETRFVHLQTGEVPPLLALHYKGPAFKDTEPDMPALDVMSTILFSSSSPLFKKLVVEERKARFIGGGAMDSHDPNLFSIQASLIKKEDMQYVKDEIVKAIEGLKVNGVGAELLSNTKSNLKYGFAMRIDNPDAVANTLCHYIALTGDPETVNRIYALYDKITAEDLKTIAGRYFTPAALTIATISADAEGGVR